MAPLTLFLLQAETPKFNWVFSLDGILSAAVVACGFLVFWFGLARSVERLVQAVDVAKKDIADLKGWQKGHEEYTDIITKEYNEIFQKISNTLLEIRLDLKNTDNRLNIMDAERERIRVRVHDAERDITKLLGSVERLEEDITRLQENRR